MAVSTALANAMLGGLPGSSYVQIHSGDPGPSGTSNVIAGPGRALVTLPAASGGQRALLTNVDVPSVPQGASVTHVSYWDAASGGTFSHSEALGVTVTFAYAGTLRFTSQTFTVTTAASGSQTATSVVADSASAIDASVIVLRVAVSDAATSTDLAATGIPHIDSATSADANAIRLGVVVGDASSMADVAIGNAGGVSANVDASSASDSVAVSQSTLSANTDTAAASESNTASESAPSAVTRTDNFDRANAANLNANTGATNWGTVTGLATFKINVNEAESASGVSANFWQADDFGQKQFSRCACTNAGSTPAIRMSETADTCIWVGLTYDSGVDDGSQILRIQRLAAGSQVTSSADYQGVYLPAEIELRGDGTTFTAYVNGALWVTWTDAGAPATGRAGFRSANAFNRISTWTGGSW